MKILIVEPLHRPRRSEILNALDAIQQIVGGHIQVISPFDDPVALVCDEEGKLKDYDLNRHINGKDIIVGTFFICGQSEDEFVDLSDELADKYEKLFYYPQIFVPTHNGVMAISANGEQEEISL